MTAYLETSVDEAVIAWIWGGQVDDTLLEEDKTLRRLEGRSGGIGSLERTVEERFQRVVDQSLVVLSAFTPYQQCGVICGGGDHGEDFTGGGFDSHYRTDFVDHQGLRVLLQADVDAQFQVASRYRRDISCPVVVTATDSATGIADEDFFPFDSSQMMIITFLDTEVAAIVSRLIIRVTLDVGL